MLGSFYNLEDLAIEIALIFDIPLFLEGELCWLLYLELEHLVIFIYPASAYYLDLSSSPSTSYIVGSEFWECGFSFGS